MTEVPQPKDPAQQNKFIELEGPEYLKEGVNFFAQPPFDKALDEVSVTYNIPQQATRVILHQLSFGGMPWWKRVEALDLDIDEEMSKLDHPNPRVRLLAAGRIFEELDLQAALYRSMRIKALNKEQYASAARTIRAALDDYPHWKEYVSSQQTTTYRPDGTYKPRGKIGQSYHKTPTLSYPHWVSTVLRGEQSAVLVGIEEIFPQDISDTRGERSTLPKFQDAKPHNRRWKILKASELVREKR